VDIIGVISYRSGRTIVAKAFVSDDGQDYYHKRWLRQGCDVVVGTAGMLANLIVQGSTGIDWYRRCKAIVYDEVDSLFRTDRLKVTDVRSVIRGMQWIFVTATLEEVVLKEIEVFEAMEQQKLPADDRKKPPQLLFRHKGAGLHRIPQQCRHILIDCTPLDFGGIDVRSEDGNEYLMRQTVLALAWHLKEGILKDVDRVLVFCNSVQSVRLAELLLSKMDTVNNKTGVRNWKILTAHVERGVKMAANNMALFNAETVSGVNMFKKRIMICTDVMALGQDFERNAVQWAVLLQFPFSASRYLRRAGRVCRAGAAGGVMCTVATLAQLKIAQNITAAAIRSLKLQDGTDIERQESGVLERFDPTKDWQSEEATAAKPSMRSIHDDDEEEDASPQGEAEETASDDEVRRVFRDLEVLDLTKQNTKTRGKKKQKEQQNLESANEEWAPWQEEEDLFDDLEPTGSNWGSEGVGISLDDF